jgi:hypothetical protein
MLGRMNILKTSRARGEVGHSLPRIGIRPRFSYCIASSKVAWVPVKPQNGQSGRCTRLFRQHFYGVVIVVVEVDELIAEAVRPGSNSKQRSGIARIKLLRADDTCRWRDFKQ